MEIYVTKNAGFCFGVKRAVERVYSELEFGKLYTYGSIIHNKGVVDELEKRGVTTVQRADDMPAGSKVVIRAHGIGRAVYSRLEEMRIEVIDCTCPCVNKIHIIADEAHRRGDMVLLLGEPNHPEVVGTNGWADNKCVIIQKKEDLAGLPAVRNTTVIAQTTFNHSLFEEICEAILEWNPKAKVHDTVCRSTSDRQKEAEEMAKQVDIMIVIGDKTSTNTLKLYEICKKNCEKTFLIETNTDLLLNIFNSNDRIGITAGASTPTAIIREVIGAMSELDTKAMEYDANDESNAQTFEQMLDETLVTLHKGDIVKGKVIQVSNEEVSVNLGYKSDGVIQKGEFSNDPTVNPSEILKEGDELEVYVIHVNDGEGNVLLSHKKIGSKKGMDKIEKAFEEKEVVSGKVIEVVKGGIIVLVHDVRVFVPSSQVSNRFIPDLNVFKGKEINLNIIELDRTKRRIVGGRKELVVKEIEEAKKRIFSTLTAGQKVKGVVSRLTDFGAFVDLGGIDGLIHISELSWGVVTNPRNVLKEGQEVEATVLNIDEAKGKVSLSLKNEENDPWNNVKDKYEVGAILEGKVVRMVPFGAFVELDEGVVGLVHISQISAKHIAKPEDELKKGQIINVKITDIDLEKKKISLSKRDADGVEVPDEDKPEADVEPVAEETELEKAVSEEAVTD